MSEQKKPQAGEWWFATGNPGDRLYIVGQCDAGRTVFQYSKGGQLIIDRDGNWKNWHHEPLCTGWDWQPEPEPEPEWFDLTPMDDHVLRTPIDNVSKGGRFAEVDGLSGATVGFAKRQGYTQFRCLLKDAPKPVESPDDWVDITHSHPDHVPRIGIDQFYNQEKWETQLSHHTTQTVGEYFRSCDGRHRCKRKDLPPLPEPKPATQTVVFHEVIVRHGNPIEQYTLEWMSDVPKHSNWFPTGRTETREVGR